MIKISRFELSIILLLDSFQVLYAERSTESAYWLQL